MKPPVNPGDLLACAIEAARVAGEHALRNTHRRSEALAAPRHDVKLKLDVECQSRAEEVIRSAFPGHALLGEEDAAGRPSGRASAYEWIIDPIDGTVNFSHGLPLWCCSIGVRRGADVVAGAVYAPAIRELYAASVDTPSVCNDAPIHVSTLEALDRAVVFTGTNKDASSVEASLARFNRIAQAVQRARIMGSAALDLCMVARGQAEGYFERGIFIWDVAAGGLIVRQAGGRSETVAELEEGRLEFLATNGRIHEALRRVVRQP
jgi:myo-inositol-1(or 4)-monophosphatase